MECSGKHILHNRTKKTLENLKIEAPDKKIYRKILQNWDSAAKPLDGLGAFETITARIGAILGTEEIEISKRAVVIMCADNGIVEEDISQSGQEVTAAVARQMGKQISSVGRMARAAGADTIPVDIGINCGARIAGVLDKKIRHGTRNFRKEAAMTEGEALEAVFTGIEMAAACKEKGYRLLALGEMGIGNTATSSAVAAALLGCGAEEVTGRGAGLCDEKLLRKKQIITEVIESRRLYEAAPFSVLREVGGLDIGGLAGVCIGGAIFRIPVVLDGVITLTAALMAERLVPGTAGYLIASHKGKEPAAGRLLNALGLEAVIEARMALGEGTGAVMLMPLLDMALCVYRERTLFSDMQMKPYERYVKR